ncbi:family 10 glycosylhydrolase [uncultured Prevotella sp.]|uniref:glycoside hydrolase family 10 protein n=1 Tax=uncultured Prevotella sp. TaxID=159272 RepID=UPI0025F2C8D2|nr:family 10 glycosylhydrolase [uncultured Prevotella sp.]
MRKLFLLLALLLTMSVSAQPKREFRGAWIQCVNGQFQGMGTQKMQQTLLYQLDELQKDGVNAIIFQVRPECDALYQSSLEPWSRFLTGQQGKAPSPYWDPLQWMIEQCHQRGMELHAWINPYRAKTKGTTMLATSHVGIQHPERCFTYDDLLILNPGIPENRDYICAVAKDIVTRYDVDGIHMDDYFYPYPAAGQTIPDDQQYRLYNNGIQNRGDWRRYNVNLFIKQFYETVHAAKPWVKVGISPFGIYRNKKSSAIGSNTNGLQNYDDLYADVLLWVNNGWLDYCVPQIYWEIGNKAADYDTLIRWWDQYAGGRPLFIGEDIERTVKATDPKNPSQNQQPAKHQLHQQMPHVKGTVLWYAKAAVDNTGNYGTMLRNNYWRYPALQPEMPFIDKKTTKKPRKVKPVWTSDGYILFWTAPRGKQWNEVATSYVVYRFDKGERVNLDNPSKIVGVTSNTYMKLPYKDGSQKYVYVVTALNRLQNESKPVKKTIKL